LEKGSKKNPPRCLARGVMSLTLPWPGETGSQTRSPNIAFVGARLKSKVKQTRRRKAPPAQAQPRLSIKSSERRAQKNK